MEHMTREKAHRSYLIGAIVVWLGLLAATVITVGDSDRLATLLIIQAGGAFWFLVLAPRLFR